MTKRLGSSPAGTGGLGRLSRLEYRFVAFCLISTVVTFAFNLVIMRATSGNKDLHSQQFPLPRAAGGSNIASHRNIASDADSAINPNKLFQELGYGHHHGQVQVQTGHQVKVQNTKPESSLSSPSSPYTYLWIIGAIHEDRPSYKGFIWDVLVSVNVLKKAGSTADFWLYVRFSPDSKLSTMTKEESRLLDHLGIKIKYLPKIQHESFSQMVYDKFLSLNMTDYKRVMFLDADTIPLMNLDYYFHLSDPTNEAVPTVLKPNFIVATRAEPCNAGMFIVEPSDHIYKKYRETVRIQRENSKNIPRHFDTRIGWGHGFIGTDDEWEAINKRGKHWNFYAAHSDQGLLYYVARYLYKDVSIAIGGKVQSWKNVPGQPNPEKDSEVKDLLKNHMPKERIAFMYKCDKLLGGGADSFFTWTCNPPYDTYAHFTGSHKPWQGKLPGGWNKMPSEPRIKNIYGPTEFWFRELNELNEKLHIGLDLKNWNSKYLDAMKGSPLGYMAMYSDQEKAVDYV